MKQKTLFLICLLLTTISLSASATTFNVGGINYDIISEEEQTVQIGDNTGFSGDAVIPESVQHGGKQYAVTTISNEAFSDCSGLTSVTIPASVTAIGHGAFFGCDGLKIKIIVTDWSVFLNNGIINKILHAMDAWVAPNGRAFDKTYDTVLIDENGEEIKDIVIPDDVTNIESLALYGCYGLTSVTIHANVTSIGELAFEGCGLAAVKLPIKDESTLLNNNIVSRIKNGFYDTEHMGFDVDYTTCPPIVLINEDGEEIKDFVIPDGVTSIDDYALYRCRLTSVTIPSSVTSIGHRAFFRGGPKTVKLYINDKNAFINNQIAYKIASETGDSGDYGYGDYHHHFLPDGFKIVLLEENGEEIKDFVIPDDITSIDKAFNYCGGLTSVTISNSVTSIGSSAFEGCSGLTSVTIPNSVTSISDNAFEGCSCLTSVTIPNSVTSIGSSAFEGCSGLTSVTIPNSVTSIDWSAFQNCSGLTSVTIPATVTSINSYAFEGCSGLTSVKVCINDKSAFINNQVANLVRNSIGKPLVLINESGEEIKNFVIPNDITAIGDYAFYNCSGLTAVTIPATVTSINSYAFEGCSGLTSVKVCINDKSAFINNQVANLVRNSIGKPLVLINESGEEIHNFVIPDDITNIGDYAFYNCSGLTAVTIPNSISSISRKAFQGCSSLTSVELHCSEIDSWFSGYTTIEHVLFGDEVTTIGDYAFYNCSGLTSVTIPNSVTSIFEGAFSGCSSMTAVTISASISSISDGVFNDCSGLTSVSIPSSVTSIGEYAFSGCSGLASVTIPVSVTSIGYSAFHDCQPTTVEVSLNDKSAFINNHVANLIRKNIRFKNLLLINESGAEEKDFIIPNDITTIGEFAFYNCSGLTSVTIPNSVTSISDNAFTGCDNLNSVVLHCPSIGNCFQGLSSIQEVFLGDEVSSISGSAFNGCSGLTSVTSKIVSPFAIQSGAFGGVSPECILTVPKGMVNEYIAKGWNMFGGGVFDESIRCIDGIYYALDSSKKTATVTNQYGYDGDSDYSWLKASYVGTLDIPDVVTYDGEQYSVTFIGKNALRKCNDLTAVYLPDGLTDAATLKDLQAKIYVNRGTTTLLALWTIGMEPYEKNTDNVLTAPKFDIATTQTTATLKATPVYPEYTYAYNDMIPLGEEGIRWTGLYPEYSEEVTLNVMLGTQCYESKQTFTTQSLAPTVIASQRTASSITFKGIYTEGDADVDDEYTLTVDGENILGDTKTLTGLEPNTGYTAYFTVRVHYGDNGKYTKSYTGTSTLQTEPISFTTLPAKIITADDVIVSSTVNLNDAETTAGFEWRVAGGDEDLFESKYGQAYLYEGMMEGTIHKLNPNYLWKFRPYYQSANGYYYYGNWKGIDLSDNQSYFEPTVHTYAGVEMGDGTATVSGYAQRGSDEIAEEGFEYWEESGNTSDAPLHAPAYASIPDNAMKVLADGTLMQAQLTGLTPNSTYSYVAFVRTTKGKTYYGVVRQFTTGEHQQATSVEAFNAKQAPTNEAIYDLLGRKHDNLHKGVNIIRMEDGSIRKVYVK